MPFGLTNAPATFQTSVNTILRKFINVFVIVYLDDVLVYSKGKEEHVQHLELVLQAIQTAGLFVKPSKCEFMKEELEFCGHLVGFGRCKPTSDKVEVIRTWPQPTNIQEIRQFMGLAAYYRRYVRRFAAISAPIYELLKSDDEKSKQSKSPISGAPNGRRPITWNVQAQDSFETLKAIMTSSPVVQIANSDKPYTIATDASDRAIGAELLQADDKSRLHPVAFDGRKLNSAELNYPVHEKELLAITFAIEKWRCYIENGHPITIITDHESLKYMKTTKKPSRRLARWIEKFEEYDLIIQYRKGEDNVVPDAISRKPDFMNSISPDLDRWTRHLPDYLKEEKVPEDDEYTADKLRSEAHLFTLVKDQFKEERLCRIIESRNVSVVEPLFRRDFIRSLHNGFGHLGFPGLYGVVKFRGWWPSIEADIRDWTRQCPNCQVSQGPKHGQERQFRHTIDNTKIRPFSRWGRFLTIWTLSSPISYICFYRMPSASKLHNSVRTGKCNAKGAPR